MFLTASQLLCSELVVVPGKTCVKHIEKSGADVIVANSHVASCSAFRLSLKYFAQDAAVQVCDLVLPARKQPAAGRCPEWTNKVENVHFGFSVKEKPWLPTSSCAMKPAADA